MNMRSASHGPLAQGQTATRIILVVVLTSLVTIGASATIPGIIGSLVMSGPTEGGPQPRGPGVSAIPTQINHQGVVAVNGQRFNGDAQFKFALVDPGPPEAYLWTNDGSTVAPPAAPTAAVTLPVIDGLFNVRLGESPAMVPIPASAFNISNVVLRVWFDDGPGGNPEQQLSPDQTLSSVPYAFTAATSPPIGTVMPFMGDTALLSGTPWVLSNGDPFPADADAALIAALGPNTPNFGGRVPRGLSGGQVGDSGGSDSITTSNHSHGLPGTTGSINGGTCGPGANSGFAVRDNSPPACIAAHLSVAGGSDPEGQHVHNLGGSTGSAGAQTISSVPSHVAVNYIIRYK